MIWNDLHYSRHVKDYTFTFLQFCYNHNLIAMSWLRALKHRVAFSIEAHDKMAWEGLCFDTPVAWEHVVLTRYCMLAH